MSLIQSIKIVLVPFEKMANMLKSKVKVGTPFMDSVVKLVRIALVMSGVGQIALGMKFFDAIQKGSPELKYILKNVFNFNAHVIWYYWLWELCLSFVLILTVVQRNTKFLGSWILMNTVTFGGVVMVYIRYLWITMEVSRSEVQISHNAFFIWVVYLTFGTVQIWFAHKYRNFMLQKQFEKQEKKFFANSNGITIIIQRGKQTKKPDDKMDAFSSITEEKEKCDASFPVLNV